MLRLPATCILRVLFLAAERGQIVGDFGGLGGGFFDFHQRFAPRMVGLGLAQEQRGVAQDAGQRVVEIQRHRARQLQRAIQFLLVRQAVQIPAAAGAPAGTALAGVDEGAAAGAAADWLELAAAGAEPLSNCSKKTSGSAVLQSCPQ